MNDLPEPGAHPLILTEPTDAFAAVRSRVTTRRLGVALFIIGFGWVFANGSLTGVLLQSKFLVLDPAHKVYLYGLATALAGVGTTISLFVWGAVSDLTRGRFGSRTPWIAFGGAAGVLFLVLIALASTPALVIVAFLAYGLTFNALVAAVLAIFADRIPREKRGSISAVYGGAQVLGGTFGSIVSSRFIATPNTGIYIGALVMMITVVLFLVLAPDFANKDVPRNRLDLQGLLASFRFPKNAPDFYWAFFGRFLLLLGLYSVQNFSLYILTDYIGLSKAAAGDIIAASGIATLVTIVTGTFLGGTLSDRLGRRKLPIFVASLLFAVGVVIPFVWPTGTAMIIFSAVTGLGLGAFLSIDTALMTEVIPTQESAGKDLGILNTANTVPQIIAPLLTAAVVRIGSGYAPVFIVALVFMVVGAFSIFKIKGVR